MEGFPDNLLLLCLCVPGEEFGEPGLPVIIEHKSRFNHREDPEETRFEFIQFLEFILLFASACDQSSSNHDHCWLY